MLETDFGSLTKAFGCARTPSFNVDELGFRTFFVFLFLVCLLDIPVSEL